MSRIRALLIAFCGVAALLFCGSPQPFKTQTENRSRLVVDGSNTLQIANFFTGFGVARGGPEISQGNDVTAYVIAHSRNLHDSEHTGTQTLQPSAGATQPELNSTSNLEDLEEELRAENERHKAIVEALERQMGRLKELSDGTEDEEVQMRQSGHGNTQWAISSIICAVLIGCCCLICQGGCLAVTSAGCLSDVCNPSALASFVYTPLDDVDVVPQRVRREMRMMMLLPLIPCIAFQETTCVDGPPNWIYFVYLPFLVRAKILEYQFLGKVNKSRLVLSFAFVLSALEHADFFTDGAFPLQALKCDPEVTELFVHSFIHSKVAVLAPIVQSLHFWGMSLILLSACIFAQQVTGSFLRGIGPDNSEAMVNACDADVAGFGALANHYDAEAEENSGYAGIFVVISKTFLENCLQLLMQSSYFALVFARTTESARKKLLFSICLGLCSASYKAFCHIRQACMFEDCGSRIIPLISSGFIMAVVAWVAAKLHYIFQCESHIWNLTTGCVPI